MPIRALAGRYPGIAHLAQRWTALAWHVAQWWLAGVLLLSLGLATVSGAEVIRGLGDDTGLGILAMGRNDDGSSAAKALGPGFPHGLNFIGHTYTTLYINNNGNITFNAPLAGFTPVSFPITNQPMIAPYWGDVDTRNGSLPDPAWNNVYYSTALPGKFIVTWYYTGYFSGGIDKLNTFQLILTDRSDSAPGDFDAEFRYERLEWTTGGASGGAGGLGGVPAQMGFDAGDRVHFYQHPESLKGTILQLVNTSNVAEPGVWRFLVRGGQILEPVLRDVSVQLTLPATGLVIDAASFRVAPQSLEVVGDQTFIRWFFPTFSAGQLTALDFEVILKDPVGGEERRVTQQLELRYTDINGQPVHTELGPQTVTMLPFPFQLGVTTDKPVYTADEPVAMTITLTNLSTLTADANVHLTVQDDSGALVADLGLVAVSGLLPGETRTVVGPAFTTGTLLTGRYAVQAELLDNTGRPPLSATAPFQVITPSDTTLSAVITTDKPVYKPLDTVLIQERIRNTTPNAVLQDLTAVTTVYAPEQKPLWSGSTALAQLLPGASQDLSYTVSLGPAAAGEYHLTLVVQDASATPLALAQTTLAVQSTVETGSGLTGGLTVSPEQVRQGDPVTLTSRLDNLGNADLVGLLVTLAIVHPATQQVLAAWAPFTVDLRRQQPYQDSRTWPAGGPLGTHVALLSARIGGQDVVLAQDTFTVLERPSAALGGRLWSDTDGNGLQETGEPALANITVFLDANGNGIHNAGENAVATDSQGRYQFSGLLSGAYQVTVTSAALPAGVTASVDPDGTATLHTALITLSLGEIRADVDFGYRPPPPAAASLAGRLWWDLDGNGIQDTNEPGIPQASVFLDRDGDNRRAAPEPETSTDDTGRYGFAGLAAGTYRVVVDSTTLPAGVTPSFDLDGPMTPHNAAVTLAAGQTYRAVDFGYRPAPAATATISDRVWSNSNGNGVVEAGEPGLSAVALFLEADSTGRHEPGEPVVLTDAQGRYAFTALPAGTYTVVVDRVTLPAGLSPSADPDGTATPHAATLALGAGEARAEVDFGYRPAPELTAALGGRLWLDTDRNGVQDPAEPGLAQVSVVLEDDVNGMQDQGAEAASTDAQGHYAFSGLAAGRYTVRVERATLPAGLRPTFDPDGTLDHRTTVTLPSGAVRSDSHFGYGPAALNPPQGFKTVSTGDLPLLVWRMVWINSGNSGAETVRMVIPCPPGPSGSRSAVRCTAALQPRAASSTPPPAR